MSDEEKVEIVSSKYEEVCLQLKGSSCNAPANFLVAHQSNIGFYMIWFNLLGFFWTIQFIDAIYIMIVAGAVGQYYFTTRNAIAVKSIEIISIGGRRRINESMQTIVKYRKNRMAVQYATHLKEFTDTIWGAASLVH